MKKIIPETMEEYKFISNPQISPDGKNAAFVMQTMDFAQNKYLGNAYLISMEGGEPVQLTKTDDVKKFNWTPDGKLIYTRPGGEKGQKLTAFFTLDIETREEEKICTLPILCGAPVITESGQWITVGMTDVNPLGEEERKRYHSIVEMPYCGDGRGIVSGQRNSIFVCDPKSETVKQITTKTFTMMGMDYCDGRLLYLGMDYTHCADFRKGAYVYDLATEATTCIVEPGRYDIVHGALLDKNTAIVRMASKEEPAVSDGRFYRIDIEEGQCTKISDYENKSEFCCIVGDTMLGLGLPNKAYDGKLYFVTVEGESGYIRSIDRDGNISMRMTKEGVTNFFDINEGGIIFYGCRGDRLGELYRLQDDGTEMELTHFNDFVKEEYYVSPRIPLSYTGSDGWEIRGWVIPPAEYEKGRKYPAILDIHGGPRGTWGSEFNHEMQMWANQGYFVFLCNPRGSAGRGDSFADLDMAMGGVDYVNFMEFTDEVLRRWPDIDETRLGVAGGSYGGYMTNWIIGHTDRFAAAASQRSISNWMSMDGLSDMGYYANGQQFGGFIEDIPEKLWDISPLKYAGNATTPTLFLQSEGDNRCPAEQALQMYSVLCRRGVDTKLILFKGESHGMSREGQPKNRLTRMHEILNWMDNYLKK